MSSKKNATIEMPVRKSSRITSMSASKECPIERKFQTLELKTPVKSSPRTKRGIRVNKELFSEEVDENKDVSPKKTPKKTLKDFYTPQKRITQLDTLEALKSQLKPATESTLLFRETECSKIEEFVKSHIENEQAASLYISGAPGTGKTMSVNFVLGKLGDSIKFKRLDVNCMKCRTPCAIYSKIVSEMGIEPPKNIKETLNLIDRKIVTPKKGSKNSMTVIVLDEIDELESKNQEVLYNLFQWPTTPGSRVIVIGIANTLDFTTRSLKRLRSCDVQVMNFQPYSKLQVKGILSARLEEVSSGKTLINDSALELCARKVASFSGDIRKALDVCRRAVEMVEGESRKVSLNVELFKLSNDDRCNPGSPSKQSQIEQPPKPVTIIHVKQVLDEVYGSKVFEVAKGQSSLPTQQQLVLCSLLLLSKNSQRKEFEVKKCHQVFTKICRRKFTGLASENSSEFLNMCQLLESKGFLTIKVAKELSQCKVSLSVDENEIDSVLTDKNLLKSVLADSSYLE